MKIFLVLIFELLFVSNDLFLRNACFAATILLFHFFAALLSSVIKHPAAKFLYSMNCFLFVHDVGFSVSVGLLPQVLLLFVQRLLYRFLAIVTISGIFSDRVIVQPGSKQAPSSQSHEQFKH